jgi:hypothetical protein
MTTYTVREYNNASAIGEITLSDEQFAEYEAAAQQPEGLIEMGELLSIGGEYVPSDIVPNNRTVYIEA